MCEGWASAGVAVLADFGGEDIYRAESLCQGGATFGIAILLDTQPTSAKTSGTDSYMAKRMSQGLGLTKGFGALIDCTGSDTYRSSDRTRDSKETEVAHLNFSQGCGVGMKPCKDWTGADGGIGVLVDLKGNDFYLGDVVSQGASCWCALGVLFDAQGDDVYLGREASQGTGMHLSVASLIDWKGNDRYSTSADNSQGSGFDWSTGYLFDGEGDDVYRSNRLVQGAGSHVSVGILADISGSDIYSALGNAQGFGAASTLRNTASLGVLFDSEGNDSYLVEQGKEKNTVRSEYGVLIDR